jgi:hypothetical protein
MINDNGREVGQIANLMSCQGVLKLKEMHLMLKKPVGYGTAV